MPSSNRLQYLVDCAYKNNDINAAVASYNEWLQSNCYHPTKQRIYDSHTQSYRYILCPCGTCYHCMETKVNEWVTRMYSHLEDFKHVYFITLTYRSFYSDPGAIRPADKLIMSKLVQAVWHRDSFNQNKRLSYNPCLLVKSHYQNFIKRLRKYTGIDDISYVLCGEYGKKYGRPHFHVILFTNSVLTKDDIVRAWSVALWRSNDGSYTYKTNQRKNGTSYYFPIGRIDFNDLVANGTLNTTQRIKVDDSYFSASRCFAYVCKYVTKRDSVNFSRVNLAYNDIYKKDKFVCLFDNEIQFDLVQDFYLKKMKVPLETFKSVEQQIYKQVYEKVIKDIKPSVFQDGLLFERSQILFGHSVIVSLLPEDFIAFRETFAPFVEFSRGRPIGSVYAINHISEFKEGVFNKPLLQDRGFVVPRYFRNKVSDQIFGVRRLRKTFKGSSYYKGGLLDFYRLLKAFNGTGFCLPFSVPRWRTSENYDALLRDPAFSLRDAGTGEKMLIINERVKYFKYSRSKRTYLSVRDVPLSLWISQTLESLYKDFCLHTDSIASSDTRLNNVDSVECKLTDLGVNVSSLRQQFISNQDNYLHHRNLMYNDVHKSVE